ncbi:MAG: hypothetical protein R2697_01015 [Ilumatobacteraceae bacterium]
MEFFATRIASSDRLMSIAYDLINGENFGGLEAHEEMLCDRPRIETYHRGSTATCDRATSSSTSAPAPVSWR